MMKLHDRRWSICNVLLVGIVITSIFFATPVFSAEQIVDFEKKSLPVLNEELQRIDSELEELIPAGVVMMWVTDTAPDGWLLCYGQAISRKTYSRLYNVIGETYGAGDSSTTFNLPDLRGRFPLGQDDMGGTSANRVTDADADSLAGADGDETKTIDLASTTGSTTLTSAQSGLPVHTHLVPGKNNGTIATAANFPRADTQADNGDLATEGNTAANAASGHTHTQADVTGQDVMNPFQVFNFIVKF